MFPMFRKTAALLATGAMLAGFSAPAHASDHSAQNGDSFWNLASQKQIPLSAILAANPGVDPYHFKLGQMIKLPDAKPTPTSYKVGAGETFWKISLKLGVPLDDLLAGNPRVNPLNVYPGLTITIPRLEGQVKMAAATPNASLLGNSVAAADGRSISYSKAITMKASAYTAAPSENGKWGAVDYFGNPLKVGTVAVDSRTIPLGSRLYITGYTYDGLPAGGMYAVASDMGGAIKGNRVDIFVADGQQKASTFGFQNVKVYVLN